jgi:myo-inositol-1(or 4)-monophosphatase
MKSEKIDIVTEADIEIGKFIRQHIHETYLYHSVLGEEEESQQTGSLFCWILDPIDETVSFIHGQFHWEVSIALQYREITILGAADCPAYHLSFFAEKVQESRRFGSIATDICFVACRKLNACWEMNVNLYNIAAALLIANEADASVTDFSGKINHLPEFPLVANGILHSSMLEILSKHHIPYELRS